jgi:hypothetical protein
VPVEQQPEEAATKPLAAAVSGVGSFAQVQMYGRGWRQRPDSTKRVADRPTDELAAPPGRRPPSREVNSSTATSQGEPEITAELVIACSEQDSAAARARLAESQQVESAVAALAAPDMAPSL